jgi:Cu/Ag efflux protein CusF
MIKAGWLLLALALVGCGSKEEGKRYPVQADVISVDQTAKSATLATGKVGDWMDAMTMEYPVKPDGDLAKLHTGDHIEATVVVQGPKYYVTGVKVVSKK